MAYTGEITANFTINKLQLNHVHEENDRTAVLSYERETNGTELGCLTY